MTTCSAPDVFLEGAERRIELILRGLAAAIGIALWIACGTRLAIAFFVGTMAAYLNFRWLHHIASRFTEAALKVPGTASGGTLALQAVLRFALLLTSLYVIFQSYPAVIPGFLAGLFVPIAAAVCEGVYEACVMIRRGG